MDKELQFLLPVKSPYKLTKNFGNDHDGVDITGDGYNSPIFASESGKVYKAFYNDIRGNQIILYHGNNIYTVYSHLNRIDVLEGQEVKRKQRIGTMGSTGMTTGVHLHFSIWNKEPYVEGNPLNPLDYIKLKEN